MGDHRAGIKIEMSFHGKTEKADMWINYYPDDSTGVDRRVTDFFVRCYEDGMARYRAEEFEYRTRDATQKAKENEEIVKLELLELDRLKEKYEKR